MGNSLTLVFHQHIYMCYESAESLRTNWKTACHKKICYRLLLKTKKKTCLLIGKSDVMHRCSNKIDTNRMQACFIVIRDEKKREENDPTEHQQLFCKTVKLDKRLFISRTFWCSRVHTLVSTLNTVETRILTGSGMWRKTSVLTVPGCTQQTNTSTRSNLKNLKLKSHQRKY